MNKVFLITGTSRGIGKELAKAYLSDENIVIGCSRSEATFTDERYHHYALDVSDENSVRKMVREVITKHGKISVLINNAGCASMNHILTTPTKSAEKIMQTNFMGTFLFSREVGKTMIKQKQGKIVNFSTVAVPMTLEGEAIYASSKAAVESFTKISAREFSEFGVTVNAIAPTPIETSLIAAVPKDKIKDLLNKQAIKRFGSFSDVKNVIDFFISKKSDFITGQIIYLGGIN